jgi:tetratricopeptide (TPR) repeat protein
MKFLAIALCMMMPLGIFCAEEAEKTKAQEVHEQANKALEAGKRLRAIELYTKAIKLDPKYVEAYNNRALVFSLSNRLDEALADCTKAIEIDPKYMFAYANRGRIYQATGKQDEAIKDFTKAIELDPKYLPNYISLAKSQAAINDKAGMIETYTKGIEQDTEGTKAETGVLRLERARVLIVEKEYDKAVEDLSAVIKASPKSGEAYNKRGVAYDGKGMNAEALADYTKALELDPKNVAAWANRASLYKKMGEKEKALADCEKLLELSPTSEEYKKMADELKAEIEKAKTKVK